MPPVLNDDCTSLIAQEPRVRGIGRGRYPVRIDFHNPVASFLAGALSKKLVPATGFEPVAP